MTLIKLTTRIGTPIWFNLASFVSLRPYGPADGSAVALSHGGVIEVTETVEEILNILAKAHS